MDLRAITNLEGERLQSGKLFGGVGPAEFPPIISPTHWQSLVGPLFRLPVAPG